MWFRCVRRQQRQVFFPMSKFDGGKVFLQDLHRLVSTLGGLKPVRSEASRSSTKRFSSSRAWASRGSFGAKGGNDEVRAESFESIGRPSACASTRCMSERSGSDHRTRARAVFVRCGGVSTYVTELTTSRFSVCLHSVIVARVYYVFGVTDVRARPPASRRRRQVEHPAVLEHHPEHLAQHRRRAQGVSVSDEHQLAPRARQRDVQAPLVRQQPPRVPPRSRGGAPRSPRPGPARGRWSASTPPGTGGSVGGVAASRRRRSDASASTCELYGESTARAAPPARSARARARRSRARTRGRVVARAGPALPSRTVSRPSLNARAPQSEVSRNTTRRAGSEAATSHGESRGSRPAGEDANALRTSVSGLTRSERMTRVATASFAARMRPR